MSEDYKNNQIIRKDAKNCFIESLNDSFPIGKAHLGFASYDMSKPAGSRQTNRINIYISVEELLELCRKLSCGELKYMFQNKKRRPTVHRYINASAGHQRNGSKRQVNQELTA